MTQKNTAKPELPSKQPKEARRTEQTKVTEVGGPSGPEPTRYGDWERGGACVDF